MDDIDVIIIGCGPSGLMAGYSLEMSKKNINYKIIEMGKSLDERDHNNCDDLTNGIGGAGLFSDGKFSWYPAGEKLWKYDYNLLKESYSDVENLIKSLDIEVPKF